MKKLITSLTSFVALTLVSGLAFAQEAAAGSSNNMYYALSAAFAIAVAVTFGTLSQAKAASAALEGIGRNPGAANKLQTPMIIAMALIESLVIFTWVIAFMLQGYIK